MAKTPSSGSCKRSTKRFRNTTSISNALLLILSIGLPACELDLQDPETTRNRLGEINMVMVSSSGTLTSSLLFTGAVTDFNEQDSVWVVPQKGPFNHYIDLRDSTGDLHRFYYSLPAGTKIELAKGMRVVCTYKELEGRAGLLMKTENDSLISMVGNFMPWEFETSQGVSYFEVISATQPRITRNTACGREGDFDLTFINGTRMTLPPAQSGLIRSGENLYLVANVSNTKVIKNINTCEGYSGEFSYMIVRQ